MAYKRLNFMVSLIKENEKVLDIGTDHGLIPILLHKKYSNIVADASDINKNPLKIARNNIKSFGMEDKIKVYLSNGVKDINISKYTTLIIAGMGGLKISSIIKQKKFKGNYILHPTINHQMVRRTLRKKGFKINAEFIVKEGKIFNTIIVAEKGFSIIKDTFLGDYIWKQDNNIVQSYLEKQFKYYKDLYNKSNNKKHKSKYKKIQRKLKWREANF